MEQLSLFEATLPRYKIAKPIRLIELFGGIGAQAKALERLKANFTHYKLVEFDIHPLKSYNAIHGTNFETLDITKIKAEDLAVRERERYEYIMTYSFPCQDLSLAGKGRGMKKGSSTRSGLLWEVERLLIELKENLPQILLMENVPQVIGIKNLKDFNLWVQFLESKGYKNYIKVLNSKNYGIPQNRERCFMISLLGNYSYTFPKEKKLDKTLLDLLEPEPVDKSYYLSDEQLKKIVWSDELKDNSILVKNATKKGYLEAVEGDGVDVSNRTETHRGTVATTILTKKTQECKLVGGIGNNKWGNQFRQQNRIYEGDIAKTITCKTLPFYKTQLTIRRETPLECWRLMGFDDEDYYKASKVNSKSQLYKQAGNSIVVNVLEAIFKQLL